jgi:hypothetical protein
MPENAANDPTEQKILAFKAKLDNPEKTGETMSIDSAVWYIEAALNYTHCHISASEIIDKDTIIAVIPATEDGTINFSDISSSFSSFSSIIENEQNDVLFADIFISDTNKSEGLEIVMVYAEKGEVPNLADFGQTDYWYAGWEEGKCGAYEGQMVGKDATTQLAYKANLTREYPSNGYITDIHTEEFNGIVNELLWSQSANNVPCLEPAEMNYWLNALKQLANENTPAGENVVGYSMEMEGILGKTVYFHIAYISYGIFHYGSPID